LNPGVKLPIEPLALFGGTFDPVHYGHLRCADEVRKKLGLNNLYLLPAGIPPHRLTPLASASQRLKMLQLAVVECPSLLLDDRETRRSGPSYMVDTLKELRAEFPGRPILLLIGQDAANHLHTWFAWELLFRLAHIVIMARPGSRREYRREIADQINSRLVSDMRQLRSAEAGSVLAIDVTPIDISATAIKNLIRLGQSAGSMLPDSVLEYINENHLYKQA
jgi:nicotinate-nucleotide adenylyltransferase